MKELAEILVPDCMQVGKVKGVEGWMEGPGIRKNQQGLEVSFVVIVGNKFVNCLKCLVKKWRSHF